MRRGVLNSMRMRAMLDSGVDDLLSEEDICKGAISCLWGRIVATYKLPTTSSARRATFTFTFTFTAAKMELTTRIQP